MLWSTLNIQGRIDNQPDLKTRTRKAIAWFIRFSLFYGEYIATGGKWVDE
ncbi:MAG: hypothetical protein VKK04_08320 [Synechococcales bacterium]|nr:hypothetical protein [Synechococcales bacterium]